MSFTYNIRPLMSHLQHVPFILKINCTKINYLQIMKLHVPIINSKELHPRSPPVPSSHTLLHRAPVLGNSLPSGTVPFLQRLLDNRSTDKPHEKSAADWSSTSRFRIIPCAVGGDTFGGSWIEARGRKVIRIITLNKSTLKNC